MSTLRKNNNTSYLFSLLFGLSKCFAKNLAFRSTLDIFKLKSFGVITILFLLFTFFSTSSFAQNPIPVDDAFQFSASVTNNDTITAHWKIAPGYHLYRDRVNFKIIKPTEKHLTKLDLPEGIHKQDDVLGKYQVFNNEISIPIPVANLNADKITFLACYQGCSDNNFCYPPVTKKVTLDLDDIGETVTGINASSVTSEKSSVPVSEQDKVTALLTTGSLGWVLLSFFGFGILLSLTPCVLPMIPILSGIIIGHGHKITHRKAFFLSLTYVLGMAITYAIVGVIAGFAGQSIQAALQMPWVIVLFSFFFVLLALSLFGFYELKLPSKFEEKIAKISNKQKSGTYLGVAIMGVLATLIVSPCVTAPLIGALAYIGKTGDAVLGGSALFVMALGMGVPLLAIGTSHGSLLPKAGNWMNTVKAFFGVLMIGVAIWMLSRVIPPSISMLLWASFLIICSIYMGLMTHPATGWQKFWKGIALIFLIYGVLLMIGAALGNCNPFQPLSSLKTTQSSKVLTTTAFQPVKGISGFEKKLSQGEANNQITLLDFYADWCIACKEMEHKTFSNPDVAKALATFNVVQADITNQDRADKALMKKYGVIAPPAILFFDAKGNEIKSARIVGEMKPKAFLMHIKDLMVSQATTTNTVIKSINQQQKQGSSLLENIKQ